MMGTLLSPRSYSDSSYCVLLGELHTTYCATFKQLFHLLDLNCKQFGFMGSTTHPWRLNLFWWRQEAGLCLKTRHFNTEWLVFSASMTRCTSRFLVTTETICANMNMCCKRKSHYLELWFTLEAPCVLYNGLYLFLFFCCSFSCLVYLVCNCTCNTVYFVCIQMQNTLCKSTGCMN